MNKEMIEKLKHNNIPNFLLPDDEFEALDRAGIKNRAWATLTYPVIWENDANGDFHRISSFVYRIKSTYQPAVVKLEPGALYFISKIDECQCEIGMFELVGVDGTFRFERGGCVFSIDPAMWTFHKIQTEEVK